MIYLSIYLISIYLFMIYMYGRQPVSPVFCRSICDLSIDLFMIYQCIYLISIYLFMIYMSVRQPVYPVFSLSIYLSIYLSSCFRILVNLGFPVYLPSPPQDTSNLQSFSRSQVSPTFKGNMNEKF